MRKFARGGIAIAKKGLAVLLALFLISVLVVGCQLGPNDEEKYESSFLEIWNELTTKEKKLEQEAKRKQDNIDEMIKVYKKVGDIHKQAKKKLTKLSAPSKLKKLHHLTLKFLDSAVKYSDELVKIAQETRGNYTEEQAQSLDKLQKEWESSGAAVQSEAKKLGWEVK